jgi:hypothetical protein
LTAILTGLGLSAAAGLNAWGVLLLFNGLFLVLPQEFPGPAAGFPWEHFIVRRTYVLATAIAGAIALWLLSGQFGHPARDGLRRKPSTAVNFIRV